MWYQLLLSRILDTYTKAYIRKNVDDEHTYIYSKSGSCAVEMRSLVV